MMAMSLPRKKQEEPGDCSEKAWEHTEQLYLLEVLLDQVVVDPAQSLYTMESPVLGFVGTVSFLDLPDMEVQPNELYWYNRKKREGEGESCVQIPGLPSAWEVKLAADLSDFDVYPQYRVNIDVTDPETRKSFLVNLLVPKIAVEAGEGLRYVFTALERKVTPELMEILKGEIKAELDKGKDIRDLNKPIVFASGKSCLFQMTPFELIRALGIFPFYVSVHRTGVVEGIPLKQLIGKVKLMLSRRFVKAVTMSETAESFPVAAHLEGIYPMENIFGEPAGTIEMFVRLSCFGCSVGRPLGSQVEEEKPSESADKEKEEGLLRVVRPALLADEETLLGRGAGCARDRLEVPGVLKVAWHRADDPPDGSKFVPRLAELMPALRQMPPPPPEKRPPEDPWQAVEGLKRCGTPGVKPPCFRRPGDPPVPPCNKAAERQLDREDRTKAVQTEEVPVVRRLPPDSPYIVV